MKRSRTVALLVMGTAPLFLAACSKESEVEGLYTSLESCVAQTNDSYTCGEAFKNAKQEAEATAPRYASREECVAAHGEGQCEARQAGSQSYFMPLMTGFLLGQMLRGGQTAGFTSSPAFKDRAGNWQRPAPGAGAGGVYRPGVATAMAPVAQQPDRAPTASRGGFGDRSGDRGAAT